MAKEKKPRNPKANKQDGSWPLGNLPDNAKEIDLKLLNAILQYGASLKECSEILECSDQKIMDYIKDNFNMRFAEYRDLKMSKTKLKLRQKQIEVALSGNVAMLIYLGKNFLGQNDAENFGNQDHEIRLPDERIIRF